MQIDTPTSRPATYHAPNDSLPRPHHEKRTSISWDTTLQKINRLEIASPQPPREGWSGYQGGPGQPANGRPVTAPHPSYMNQQQPPQPVQAHPSEPKRNSQEAPTTPIRNKRQAWYNGPLSQPSQPGIVGLRTSPEDSSSSEGVPTPSNSSTDYNPAIVHSNGYVEKQPLGPPVEEQKPAQSTSIMDRPHPIHQYQQYHNHGNAASTYQPRQEYNVAPAPLGRPQPPSEPARMTALDALVAVATGEQQAVTNRS
jgi:hypothetical protein